LNSGVFVSVFTFICERLRIENATFLLVSGGITQPHHWFIRIPTKVCLLSNPLGGTTSCIFQCKIWRAFVWNFIFNPTQSFFC